MGGKIQKLYNVQANQLLVVREEIELSIWQKFSLYFSFIALYLNFTA
jgi:hypothetical protein